MRRNRCLIIASRLLNNAPQSRTDRRRLRLEIDGLRVRFFRHYCLWCHCMNLSSNAWDSSGPNLAGSAGRRVRCSEAASPEAMWASRLAAAPTSLLNPPMSSSSITGSAVLDAYDISRRSYRKIVQNHQYVLNWLQTGTSYISHESRAHLMKFNGAAIAHQ